MIDVHVCTRRLSDLVWTPDLLAGPFFLAGPEGSGVQTSLTTLVSEPDPQKIENTIFQGSGSETMTTHADSDFVGRDKKVSLVPRPPTKALRLRVALSPGHSQILSRSRGEKSGEFSPWLRYKICEWPGDKATQARLRRQDYM